MSKSIDKRIVEMEFDNAQFEREVKRSQSTLEKLKELLNFGDQKKGLSDLSSAAKNVDMSSMASNLETVSDRFSTMGIIGMTVLQRLTDAALDLGKKLWDISIGQVIEGGSKRALNLEQAAFRFKGIGVDVETAMESANKSVLGTMYGFDQAASAGSQLAASGVEVGDSLYKALRGTAGLAAMTGSEFEDISNIMVAVAGQGRLMGDQLNRFSHRGLNVAATLAKSLGISEEKVREMVTKGQISFDMFSEAMYEAFGEHATGASELFSGAMAHAKAALSRIGGTFAPAIFNNMRDVLLELRYFIDGFHNILKPYLPQFEAFADQVGKIAIGFLKDTDWSPMTSVVDGLINILKSLWSWIKPIGQAFRDIFPPTTTKALSDLTGRFKSFTEGLEATDKQSSNVRKGFKGLFSIIKVLGDIFGLVWKVIFKGVGIFDGLGSVILTVSGFIGGLIAKVLSYVDVVGWASAAMTGLKKAFDVAKTAFNVFKKAMEPVRDILSKIATMLGEKVVKGWVKFRDEVLKTLDPMKMFTNGVETISNVLVGLYNFFKPLVDIVKDFIMYIGREFIIPGWEKFTDIVLTVRDLLVEAKDTAIVAFGELQTAAAEKFNGASTAVGSFGDKISDTKNKFFELGDILKSHFMPIIDKVKDLFGDMGLKDFFAIAVIIWLIAQVKHLIEAFDNATYTISDVFQSVVNTLEEVQNTLKSYQNNIKADTVLKIAGAIALLVAAVALIGFLDGKAIAKGLGTIVLLFGLLGGMMYVMDKLDLKVMGNTTNSLFALSGSLLILAAAIMVYSKMDWGQIGSGLLAITVVLLALAAAVFVMDNAQLSGVAGAILAMSLSLIILAAAIVIYSNMDYEKVERGLIIVATLLLALTAAVFVMKGADLKGAGAAIAAIALALTALIIPVMVFGNMDTAKIEQGLTVLAALLLGITLAVMGMTATRGDLEGAAASIKAMAIGILALTIPLIIFGNLDYEVLKKGLTTMIIMLAAVSGALIALGLVEQSGADFKSVSAGLLSLSAALIAISFAVKHLSDLTWEEIAKGIVGLLVPLAAFAAVALLLAPVAGPLLLLSGALVAVGAASVLLGIGMNKIIDSWERAIPVIKDFIQLGKDVVGGLVKGLADGIVDCVNATIDLGKSILDGIKNFFGIKSPSTVMSGVGGDVVLGLIKGIGSKISSAAAKAKELGSKVLNALKDLPGKLLTKGKEAAGDFVKGVSNKFGEAKAKATELGNKVQDGLKNLKSKLLTSGKDAISGFISGMSSKLSAVANAARNIASRALSSIKSRLNIASPSKVFRDEVGAMIALGVRDGIKIEAKKAEQAAVDMGKDVLTRTREYLDQKKYYNQISLEEELYVWQQAIKELKYGSEERKAMDRELYRVRNEIQRKGFEDSKKWIDEEKFYNRLSLGEELTAWQRIQAKYKAGTEERKEADRQVYSLKKALVEQQEALDNSYYENSKSINDKLKDDIKSLNDDYDNAVESRAKSLAETWGLFNKVDKKDAVSGKELVTNLEGQVEAFNEWEKEIHKLSGKGLNEALMKELENLGPNSIEEIKALNSLSNHELENYSNLWLTKFDNARKYALGEMQDLRTETDVEIANLTKDADEQLAELESVWVTKTAELTGKVVVNFDKMKVDVGTSVTAMKTETVADFDDWVKDIKKTVEKQDWESVGSNMISGISKGIASNSKKLIDQMTALATKTINTVNSVLGIKSPSRVFAKIGAFAIQGFINGVDSLNDQASKSTSDVATDAMNALKNALGRIDEAIDSDVDLSPVIRPVLDMDDVINELNNNLGSRNIDVSAAQSRLSRLRRESEIERQNGSKSTAELKQEVHYHAHLKTYGSLPKTAIDKMAKDFDASIKDLEDRRKMNRGEEVIF